MHVIGLAWLIRNRDGTLLFENLISKPEVELLDDNKYKQIALSMVFESNLQRGYSYSLVDSVIREILKDKEVQIDYLITYNEKDFADVCEDRNLRNISGN